MIQNNYFSDNDDLVLQFEELINWQEIVEAFENGFEDAKKFKETGDSRLEMAPDSVEAAIEYYRTLAESFGELVGKEVAGLSQEMDKIGLKFDSGKVTFPEAMNKAYRLLQESGFQPYSISRQRGGLGLPLTAQGFLMEILSRADASMAIAFGCANLGETIERFAAKEMADEWVPKMSSGEYTGAMALTEPNHGSDLSNVRTRAEKDENGVWRLTGTKRFITHGCGFTDTPSVILTLARTGSPTSGARGLSFFIVKSQDVEIASIEKKLGLHCSPTCEVVYDNSPGLLIGQEGHGLTKYAMGMMNAARFSIAAQSTGIAAAGYAEAKKYASERMQFGKEIEKIPAVKKMLDRMEREVSGMRILLYEASRTVDLYAWRQEHLQHAGMNDREIRKDEQVRKWEKLANLFTPLSKYYSSEGCNQVAFDAIQIHGGSGFTEEYDVARIYRDARITNIYEGTTQLQVVAAIGGIVSGMTATGHLRAYIDEEMSNFSPSEELIEVRKLFEEAVEIFRSIEDGDLRDALAFEVVESGARFIVGMLYERGIANLSRNDRKDKITALAQDYHLDSLAIIQGNLVKLRAGAKGRKKEAALA